MTDANGNDWDYGHDAAGNETSTTDPNSNVWQTEFDDLSRVSAEIDPLLNETDTSYWENGDVQNVTDGRGFITRYVTDWAARTQTTIGAYGTADQFNIDIGHFNDAGFTTEIENGNGDSTFYIDDGYHRVGEIDNDNSDMRAIYTRDAIGNVTAAEDGETKTTAFGHDALERTATTTDANNNTTQPVLDAEDEEVGFIDGAGAVTEQVFDPRGLETLTVDANGGKTRREYDAAGNLWRLTDPVGNTTSWARDANGNVIQETDALGNSRYWTFDDANRVISYTDKNGRSKEYTYYDNNLLYQEIWKTAPGGSTVNTITYTWNENGQLLTATDNTGTITQTWDSANRLDTFEGVYGGTLTYVYNDASQLEEIDDSFGGSTTLTWNNIGQLTQRSFTDGTAQLAVGYQYNDRDQVTEVDRYTDAAATTLVGKTLYTIDDGGRVTDISHKNASNVVIDSFSYTFDHADRVTQETSTLGPTQNYDYDRTGQLISDSSTSYSFDLNGNRTMTGYSTGTDNRLSTDGTWNYDYDDEGNTIAKTNISTGEVWQFSYDHNNRLIEAEHKPSSSGSVDLRITFVIDVLGNRVERDYDADGDGSGAATVTKFAVDPNANAWADLSSTGSLTIRRLYADAVDAIFARIGSSGNEDWYGEDRLGSIRDIFDSSGSLIDQLNYSSYGKPVYESNSANSDRYGFQAREREDDFGATNLRERYLLWDSGRFNSIDPSGLGAGANPYRGLGNDPSNMLDPWGLHETAEEAAARHRREASGRPISIADQEAIARAIANGTTPPPPSISPAAPTVEQALRDLEQAVDDYYGHESEVARRSREYDEQMARYGGPALFGGGALPAAAHDPISEAYRHDMEGVMRATMSLFPGGAQIQCIIEGDWAGAAWATFFDIALYGAATLAGAALGRFRGPAGITWTRTNHSRLIFDGLEVRAVRDLSHVSESTLRAMADARIGGFAPNLPNGQPIVLHHLGQRPYGPIVEMPANAHRITHPVQHPFGNQPGFGLSPQQREAFNLWRADYWRARAVEELARRGVRL